MIANKVISKKVDVLAFFSFVSIIVCYCGVVQSFSSTTLETKILNHINNDVHINQKRRRTTKLNSENNNGNSNPFSAIATLEQLDRQWKLEQSNPNKRSRWSKLVLPKDDDGTDSFNNINADGSVTQSFVSELQKNDDEDFVYLLEPPNNNIPSCLIVFVGGAGVGQFPNIAYSEFLTRISNKLNAAVLAAPYTVKLDHFDIAKKTGEKIRKGILLCEDDITKMYPSSLPTYCIAHSLGCKLQTIYMAATGQQYEGVGFLSYNNFGFAKTISMVRDFAEQMRKSTDGIPKPNKDGADNFNSNFGTGTDQSTENVINNIFGFAETMVGAIGVDFTPNAENTKKIIEMKYDQQSKTRLFVFDDDTLDTSKEFYDCCQVANNNDGTDISVSGLPGTHLTPVFFKIGVDDIPDEAKGIASEALGGFKSASFGVEENLDQLVKEVSDWILGGNPSKQPNDWAPYQPPKQLTSSKDGDE